MSGRLFAVLLISAGIVAAFAGRPFIPEPPPPNYTEQVGVIEATELHLSTKISERITAIPFDEGDWVPKGAVVAKLDTEELAAEAARTEADILRAEADILTAKALLEREKAAHADAGRNLSRIVHLFKDKLVSIAKRDAAQTRLELAEAEILVASARVRAAETALKQHQAHRRLFEVRMQEGTIRSPVAGRVSLKAYEPGEHSVPGDTLLTLLKTDSLWARIDLEEGLLERIRLGSRAEIFFASGGGRAIPGSVVEIGTAGSFATQRDTTRGRQDIKTFRIKVRPENTQGLLKPGMSVKVRLYFEPAAASPPKVVGPEG